MRAIVANDHSDNEVQQNVTAPNHQPTLRKNTAEPARKIRRRRPDIIRTIRLGYSNSRLEASDNRIKVTIRMAYGFHHANSLIALVMLRCAGNHGASDNRDTPLLTYRRSMVL